MPIYEYQCDSCGSQRELILKHGEVAKPTCAACRKRMRRVISKTAFILKGSGWYVTDYPSDARKKGLQGEKATPAAGTGGEKKDAAGSEPKDAAAGKVPAATEKKPAAAQKKPAAPAAGAAGKREAKQRR